MAGSREPRRMSVTWEQEVELLGQLAILKQRVAHLDELLSGRLLADSKEGIDLNRTQLQRIMQHSHRADVAARAILTLGVKIWSDQNEPNARRAGSAGEQSDAEADGARSQD